MTKRVAIVGAGRQGRNVYEILSFDRDRYAVAGFLDDTKQAGETVLDCPVLGGFDRLGDRAFVRDHAWFVAVGDNPVRQRIGRNLQESGAEIVNAIHPNAAVSTFCDLGVGVYVAAFVKIGSGSRIGDWALAESSCTLGCDTVVGEGASFGPTCVLTGGASVGDLTVVGAGTVVTNNVSVGARCIIGANAVVVRDLPDGVRAQGVPARVVARSIL